MEKNILNISGVNYEPAPASLIRINKFAKLFNFDPMVEALDTALINRIASQITEQTAFDAIKIIVLGEVPQEAVEGLTAYDWGVLIGAFFLTMNGKNVTPSGGLKFLNDTDQNQEKPKSQEDSPSI